MNILPILRARFIGWYLDRFFFNWINNHPFLPCTDQRESMYGFHRFINPPGANPAGPGPVGYYDYYLRFPNWPPPPPTTNLEPTRFDEAIMYGIQTVWRIHTYNSRRHHHCFVLITDGVGAGAYPFEVFAYSAVKAFLGSKGLCMCAMCVYVGNGSFPANLRGNCARMDAQMFSHANIWWLGFNIRGAMYRQIHRCRCQCPPQRFP